MGADEVCGILNMRTSAPSAVQTRAAARLPRRTQSSNRWPRRRRGRRLGIRFGRGIEDRFFWEARPVPGVLGTSPHHRLFSSGNRTSHRIIASFPRETGRLTASSPPLLRKSDVSTRHRPFSSENRTSHRVIAFSPEEIGRLTASSLLFLWKDRSDPTGGPDAWQNLFPRCPCFFPNSSSPLPGLLFGRQTGSGGTSLAPGARNARLIALDGCITLLRLRRRTTPLSGNKKDRCRD
jgi:hypothetical protein